MGLRKLNIDRRTADQILQDMTPEEREQFERDCEEQLKCTHNGELLESIKADPSANFEVYGDREWMMTSQRQWKA